LGWSDGEVNSRGVVKEGVRMLVGRGESGSALTCNKQYAKKETLRKENGKRTGASGKREENSKEPKGEKTLEAT